MSKTPRRTAADAVASADDVAKTAEGQGFVHGDKQASSQAVQEASKEGGGLADLRQRIERGNGQGKAREALTVRLAPEIVEAARDWLDGREDAPRAMPDLVGLALIDFLTRNGERA